MKKLHLAMASAAFVGLLGLAPLSASAATVVAAPALAKASTNAVGVATAGPRTPPVRPPRRPPSRF